MTTPPIPVIAFETRVKRFRPAPDRSATNPNDLRRFLYDWFAHFEHAAPVDFYLDHLDDKNMQLIFPGMAPLTSHAAFTRWYENLLAQTLWNFHDISAIQIQQTAPGTYRMSFIVDWFGEVKADSDQRSGWQSRSDSALYHHIVRQTWTVTDGDRLRIEKLVVSPGDTPSPIRA
jgi:hypothetical protein